MKTKLKNWLRIPLKTWLLWQCHWHFSLAIASELRPIDLCLWCNPIDWQRLCQSLRDSCPRCSQGWRRSLTWKQDISKWQFKSLCWLTRHANGSMKQSCRLRRNQMISDTNGSGSRSNQCDSVWIASERWDVSLDPMQGQSLIPQTLKWSFYWLTYFSSRRV